ncbi:hypothetical protein [Flavobacterium sp. GT3R68]|uniref:hypothetical protein n=1 Tax=Flavobacterium sp. GT3R68 TaxID=2594437 RepID=UPI000F863DCD|nr:hypothetical protein [Flavobacterium sp. GT3R68]RTY87998.1 hypothetical protein EKL32_25450 [Flavobacterium sp. GSN2]TRW91157.1 hypothetical protein FNW07_10065 [Flavobacterium sp. GT3R68]
MSTTTEAPIPPKKSTSEKGHAVNVANLQELIAFVTGLGTTYNPSKPSLKLAQLNTLVTNANAHLANVININVAYNNMVNERVSAFRTLKPLATRLINALDITDATDAKVADAKAYNKKIQGPTARTRRKLAQATDTESTTISTSQQSYDMQIQHFAGLIATMQSEPSYAPNETDLKIAALVAKHTDLIAKNKAVSSANAKINNARIARDTTLYAPDSGLVDTATEVKKYIKSIYGGTSPYFEQVKGIQFLKAKK